ncbi:sugar phosphate isomerase/epimerase family protein [Vallitalea maricola]|uniref:Sugar phosphate isomerase/epimerase n=1 Tax=Vallitalea maricola TaxID=3074433 RepID=A0ACB5UGQ5_9FIRM|nr:sugar phosphate isomerase/epimerase [Vallitalea sp. AN17-2]
MNVGVLIRMEKNVEEKFKELIDMGMNSCQLVSWNEEDFTIENADIINAAVKKYDINITAFWCGWSGPVTWDFYEGPITLGIVPRAYRFARIETLKRGSDFAKLIGIRDIVTHAGFIPENPRETNYYETVAALKQIVQKCKENEQNFLFETGQETPVTLLRLIEDIGESNVGINLDPANLIMYGKANPVDSLEVFGKYVMGVHGKDGIYPIDGKNLGKEVPLGQGKVDYPKFVAKLKEIRYQGDITIEREISGEKQKEDIKLAKSILEKLL